MHINFNWKLTMNFELVTNIKNDQHYRLRCENNYQIRSIKKTNRSVRFIKNEHLEHENVQ